MYSVRALSAIAMAIAAGVVFSGCSSPETPVESPTATETTASATSSEITVWLNGEQSLGLEVVAAQFFADTGVAVELVTKEDPAGEVLAGVGSPDVLLDSYESVPELVAGGKIQDFEILNDKLIPGSIQAFGFQGLQYGLPVFQENIALVCNSEAVPSAPETFDEAVETGLAISLNNGTGDPYHFYPLQSSFGSSIFEVSSADSAAPILALDSEQGYAFASWLGENRSIFDLESDTRKIKDQLVAGEKACWITGPWNAAWFTEQFGESGWSAYPIPAAGEFPAAPFLGVTGSMLGVDSVDAKTATKFITEYLGSKLGQLALFQTTGMSPSHLEALDEATTSKVAHEFGLAGVSGVPMPAIDQMDSVWGPLGTAQASIIAGSDDPAVIWKQMADEINAMIGN